MYKSIKIINDRFGVLKNNVVKAEEKYSLFEPTRDKENIDFWANRLSSIGIKYAIIQVDTTVPNPVRYVRGYVILIPENSTI